MKIANRSGFNRSYVSRPSTDFLSNGRESFYERMDCLPIENRNTVYFTKRDSCPAMYLGSQFQKGGYPKQQSVIVQMSNFGVGQPIRESQPKEDWKILTLKQIKDIKGESSMCESNNTSRMRSSRGLHVSISKSNRGSVSVSREKKTIPEPKLTAVGGNHVTLKSLSNKRQIVDKIELQLEQEIKISHFFCG